MPPQEIIGHVASTPTDTFGVLLTAIATIVAAALALLGRYVWGLLMVSKNRVAEADEPIIARSATSLLVEKMGAVDRHVLDVRDETHEIAETARDIAKTAERQEHAIGRVHEICAETKTILENVNRRLDRLEER